jgi:hypothetical protein
MFSHLLGNLPSFLDIIGIMGFTALGLNHACEPAGLFNSGSRFGAHLRGYK